MKVMIRRGAKGYSVYVPKKDLEEDVVETQSADLWGGWVKLRNGLVLELPAMDKSTTLPITVSARVLTAAE
jgi:nitrogen fixation protein NifT